MRGRVFDFLTHPRELVRQLGCEGDLAISFMYEGCPLPVRSADIHVCVMSRAQAESLVESLQTLLSQPTNPEPKEAA